MTAATATRITTQFGPPSPTRISLPVAANTQYFGKTLIAIDSNGRAVNPTDGDGNHVVGVSDHMVDNRTGSELGGANDATDIELHCGVVGPFVVTGAGTLRPRDIAYVVDNQTVSADDASGTRGIAGRVLSNRGGKVFLWVGPHVATTDTEADFNTALTLAGSGSISVPVPLTAFADGVTNGYDATVFGFRLNNAVDDDPLVAMVSLPADLDDASDVVIKVNGYIIDDAVDDDVNWVVTARFDGGADVAPAGVDVLGEAAAVESFVIDAADVPAGPVALHITVRADNNLDTSDAVILGVEVSYTKAVP